MVRIRLRRTGKKKQASYRVVVANSESPRDGRFIENIGFYNPRTDPPTIEIKSDRALYWLSQGAQPTDAVARLLRKKGILTEGEALDSGEPAAELEEPQLAETEPEAEAEIEAAVDETKPADEPEPGDETEPADEPEPVDEPGPVE